MRSLLAIILAVGCSSSSSPSSAISSLGEAKTLASLSKDEIKQYCLDMTSFRKKQVSTPETVRVSCGAKALTTVLSSDQKTNEALRAACKQTFDECVAKPPVDEPLDCSSSKVMEELASCKELTVGDMNACVLETRERMKAVAKTDPCADVETDVMKSIDRMMDAMKGPKCQLVETKCKDRKPSGASGGAGSAAQGPAAGNKPPGPGKVEILAKLDGFQKQMCECKDKACADGVNDSLTKWGTEMAKTDAGDHQPDAETVKQSTDSMTRYSECMTKLMSQTPPPPPPPLKPG
jgi:hypothetical protein